jgi:uncharacterized membrane protein YeiH
LDPHGLIYGLDLLGTAVFAFTGAIKALRHQLDILGVVVLATITGAGGGMLRDLVLGDTPPAAFRDERYLIVALAVGLLVFMSQRFIRREWSLIKWADALGLGVFTAIGAAKGMDYQLGLVGILFTGAVTATGGGIIRDMLVREVPAVISRDFYATASLAGALLFVLIYPLQLGYTWQMGLPLLMTFLLRGAAIVFKIHLPKGQMGGDLNS